MRHGSLNVLLVDDDENTALLFGWIVRKLGGDVCLEVAQNGQTAIDYLTGKGLHSDRTNHPLPDLIVLDLMMPGITGFDVLDWLRNSQEFCSLPVVVFTGCADNRDRENALSKGAADYIVKPVNTEDFQDAVAEIVRFGERRLQRLDSSA